MIVDGARRALRDAYLAGIILGLCLGVVAGAILTLASL